MSAAAGPAPLRAEGGHLLLLMLDLSSATKSPMLACPQHQPAQAGFKAEACMVQQAVSLRQGLVQHTCRWVFDLPQTLPVEGAL